MSKSKEVIGHFQSSDALQQAALSGAQRSHSLSYNPTVFYIVTIKVIQWQLSVFPLLHSKQRVHPEGQGWN